MARQDRLSELRAEVRKRQQAVSRKIKRLENNGINISNSKHDPRRDNAPIDKYTLVQLETYHRSLDRFMDRKNQYVPDTWGRPIPRSTWLAYKRAERRANRMAEQGFASISHIYNPINGMTIGQRRAATESEFPKTANPAVNSPFRKIERVPQSIANRKALEKLTKQQQRKVAPEYRDIFVRRGRKELRKMLQVSGRMDIYERTQKLSDDQFHILWGWTGFASDISTEYEIRKPDAKPNAADEQVSDDSMNEAIEMIDWVATIKPSKKKQYKDTNAGIINLPYNNTNAGPIDL